jgi:hypothetical protein
VILQGLLIGCSPEEESNRAQRSRHARIHRRSRSFMNNPG